MQQIFFQALHVATGLDVDSEVIALRSHAMFGQLLVFLVSRETILRNLHVRELTPSHIAHIQDILRQNVRACMQPLKGSRA